MLSINGRWVGRLMAVLMTVLPLRAEGQTVIRSSEAVMADAGRTHVVNKGLAAGQLDGPIAREAFRLTRPIAVGISVGRARQQPPQQKRSWIGRHPVIFGTLAGFGAGFLIGYLPGDDAVFDDFTAGFNGWVLGGVGGGTGAAIGAIVGASTK
jgi:hypothetical protein